MNPKLTPQHQEELDEALEALQPFYDTGDDGDSVRMALNAIAGILGERTEIDVEGDDGLNGLLEALNADEDLRAAVDELYEKAGEGAYGEGLSKKAASRINALVQEIEEPLLALVKKARPKSRQRTKAARSKKS